MSGTPEPSAQTLFATAQSLHRQGKSAEAEQNYRAALAIAPHNAEALEWLGVLCLQNGQQDEALELLQAASDAAPQRVSYHDNLAAALVQARRPAEAVKALRRSVAAAPDVLATRVHLGELLGLIGHYNEAMAEFDHAIDMDPVLKNVCRDTSGIADEKARSQLILQNCQHILSRYPYYAPAVYSKSCALQTLGRMDEARTACEQAIALNPTIAVYYHNLVHSGSAEQKQKALAALEKLTAHEDAMPEDGRTALHFLLAKAYDDAGRFEDSFTHLRSANALKRQQIQYDEAHEIGQLSALAAAFTPARLQELSGGGVPNDKPVFIVGMFRSGTTLIEQILASHPAIYGGGELPLLPDLVREKGGLDATDALLTPQTLRDLGERYGTKTAAMAPTAKRITDKQPYNFRNVGLIHLALPGARIIHITRNPLDTCFSCYSLMFAGEIGFAYDMGEMGRYYKAYEALMAHWRKVLPEGAILDVQYEDVVADLEGQARRLIAYCGLDWDERCLSFHKTDRAVSTASLYQVRQPLYASAVGRAQVYDAWLRPLKDALGIGD